MSGALLSTICAQDGDSDFLDLLHGIETLIRTTFGVCPWLKLFVINWSTTKNSNFFANSFVIIGLAS